MQRILVIEDEEAIADALTTGLSAEGFAVSIARRGDTGLEIASKESFDLIVLDILLPGRNGYQVCAALRSRGIWTPILMLTAKDGELDEAEGLDTGADDFLRKPFHFEVLIARIRALLRRGIPQLSEKVEVGDLRLDRAAHRCWRGEVEIDLTPREFDLLAVLLDAAGKAVPKAVLLEKVWGSSFEGDPNIIEVYVGYLRRKVDRPFSRNAIETVRGIGYRLEQTGG
jgi:DNA-binding response OmpR family regulator